MDQSAAPVPPPLPPGSAESPERQRLSGPAWVRMALLFYGVVLAVAIVWRVGIEGEPLFYASAGAAERGVRLGPDLAAGLAAAALVIVLSRELTRRTASGQLLAQTLGRLIGSLTLRECVLLALASGIGEEAFFRGALQPRVGLVAASLLFGAAHFVPRRGLVAWSAFSVAAGFLLGGLFAWTGNLLAPIAAHVGINAVNLRLLTLEFGRDEEEASRRL
ncbi:MAG TPA: CPBP family intramembrane glutamic endopeptidase [Myxococcota bacterium]|nr:CPBP family intramembrane glutamic endopeptidase [Myxococcota bacterium]